MSNLSELNSLERANEDYLHGLEYLQTSCIKCRFKPNYLDAIPFLKKAAEIYRGCGNFEREVETRELLVRCFKEEQSFWEEGNEYQKMCQAQINQLKKIPEAKISIINAFNAFGLFIVTIAKWSSFSKITFFNSTFLLDIILLFFSCSF